jgi:ubiquinone/menaquinone biosynthesis C-methylase UbiE
MDAIDRLAKVRDHYHAPNLTDRLKAALSALGPEDRPLTVQQLSVLDQFHTRGAAATAELAKLAAIGPGMAVLDVGCGIGGPARFLAASHGCDVTGVDLSESFVETAQYLTRRAELEEHVSFQTASALELPFGDAGFDAVFLQHVAMNISDRARLYREIRRMLKPSGRFATFDVVSKGGDLHFPVPWARTAGASFLMTADATRQAIEQAGFRTLAWQDDTETAKAWFAQLRESGPPPAPNLGLVVGPDFPQLLANMARNLMEGRIAILTAVFEAILR